MYSFTQVVKDLCFYFFDKACICLRSTELQPLWRLYLVLLPCRNIRLTYFDHNFSLNRYSNSYSLGAKDLDTAVLLSDCHAKRKNNGFLPSLLQTSYCKETESNPEVAPFESHFSCHRE